jgi:hypothetical protein
MIQGYILTRPQAEEVVAAVAGAWIAAGESVGWLPGIHLVHSGTHAGAVILTCADSDLATIYGRYGKLGDQPEFGLLIDSLGGLDARQDLGPSALIDPNAEDL